MPIVLHYSIMENKRIAKHQAFWRKENTSRLTAFRIGDYFMSRQFTAAHPLLTDGKKVEPEQLSVADFFDDYLRMYRETEEAGQDAFFTATPFTGIPWMEAIVGCPVYSTKSSFIAKEIVSSLDRIDPQQQFNQTWLDKYLEFTGALVELSDGRFPVGQPIMRGPADILGTMMGQSAMVLALYDSPEEVRGLLHNISKMFLDVIARQKKMVPRFHGGESIGFYDLWTPDSCIWFQDDLTALLSPELYEAILYPVHKTIPPIYRHSLVHIHPTSFYTIDYLLEIDELDCIQINKDEGGPSVEEMLPVFKKVLARKKLVIWGSLTKDDLLRIDRELDPAGLETMVCTETLEEAKELL